MGLVLHFIIGLRKKSQKKLSVQDASPATHHTHRNQGTMDLDLEHVHLYVGLHLKHVYLLGTPQAPCVVLLGSSDRVHFNPNNNFNPLRPLGRCAVGLDL